MVHKAVFSGRAPDGRFILTCGLCRYQADAVATVDGIDMGTYAVVNEGRGQHIIGKAGTGDGRKCAGCGGNAQFVWQRSGRPRAVCFFCLARAADAYQFVDLEDERSWELVGELSRLRRKETA